MVTTITGANYDLEVGGYPGRVLIDFYTPTCSPCRMMAPLLDQIAVEQGDKLKVVKINAMEDQKLAIEFGIRVVPTFVLVVGGTKKAQVTGLQSKKSFEKWLAENGER